MDVLTYWGGMSYALGRFGSLPFGHSLIWPPTLKKEYCFQSFAVLHHAVFQRNPYISGAMPAAKLETVEILRR